LKSLPGEVSDEKTRAKKTRNTISLNRENEPLLKGTVA
jgi:hypothetical protein